MEGEVGRGGGWTGGLLWEGDGVYFEGGGGAGLAVGHC